MKSTRLGYAICNGMRCDVTENQHILFYIFTLLIFPALPFQFVSSF
ncbi:hypothetical protein T4C_13714 [Trichinella pseudospiralis]|uniref:Uncharacterized protein n=1 Tax=Trichinella pseudospiralis TaxID=6337 RepID=A0A0V1GB44_TRIPS|nr:hypothetical protein T4C_6143 [Trichinella pseudospiralis]KRY95867.1 hypothetical protein T4C_7977 [Trichinella pseudospiralis]KRY97150.1 hypothetical protein T4C_13714 [Trichinella pseudospiralis]